MELVLLIVLLALAQFIYLSMRTGFARVKYKVHAPAVTGHPLFERQYRVQQNTLEQLVVFVPVILIFANLAEAVSWPGNEIAAFLGVIWIIGRGVYAAAYVKDPASRGPGFLMTFAPSALMLLGSLVALVVAVAG